MHRESFHNRVFQALQQAGLEVFDFQERLDLGDLTREATVRATMPGHRPPARVSVEFGYFWSALDTARSLGEIEADPLGDAIELICTLRYYPLSGEYAVKVHDLVQLRAFTLALVERLPLALKDEDGNNQVETRLLMGEGDASVLYGPLLYQVTQLVALEEQDAEDIPEPPIQAELRDLATDAYRGLMALEAFNPPEGLFSAVDIEAEE
jgi:hypothetical protein